MFYKGVLSENRKTNHGMTISKLSQPTINHLRAGFRDADMLAFPVKPSPILTRKTKNPTAWVLVHMSNMLITGLSATILDCLGTVTGLTSDNGPEGVQNNPRGAPLACELF